MAILQPSLLQSRTYLGMSTLRDLIFKRPSRQFQYLHVLLDLSSHEKDKVTFETTPGQFTCRLQNGFCQQQPMLALARKDNKEGVTTCLFQGGGEGLLHPGVSMK